MLKSVARESKAISASTLAPTAGISRARKRKHHAIAVRTVELSKPLVGLSDTLDYPSICLFILWDGSPIARVDMTNNFKSVSSSQLRDIIVRSFGKTLEEQTSDPSTVQMLAQIRAALIDGRVPSAIERPARLPAGVSVSIIVPTCGRPDDLRNCLENLSKQNSVRPREIIVVDNRPLSELTPSVVREFPQVKLVTEERHGISYARNAGVAASTGEIIVMTDDDAIAPPDWLENLLAPYVRADVMGVTGNILPLELETGAQRLFEEYGAGGLGRGFVRWEADARWFKAHRLCAVRTWMLGAGANMSFRSSTFHNPAIGLMEEMLGAGMPSGSGEDLYHFYRILKAGYTIAYEPNAFVSHKHRRTMPALHQQLFNYSRGGVSYQLITLLRDRDWRALPAVLLHLALWHTKRILRRLAGRSTFPISLNITEIAGHLSAPWALWKSYRCVKRLGRSTLKRRSQEWDVHTAQKSAMSTEVTL